MEEKEGINALVTIHTHTHSGLTSLLPLSFPEEQALCYWKWSEQSKSRKGRGKNRWGVPFKSCDWWVSAWAQCNTRSPV